MASALMLVGMWMFAGLIMGLANVYDPPFLAAARRGYEHFNSEPLTDARLRVYILAIYVVGSPIFFVLEFLSAVGKLRRMFSP